MGIKFTDTAMKVVLVVVFRLVVGVLQCCDGARLKQIELVLMNGPFNVLWYIVVMGQHLPAQLQQCRKVLCSDARNLLLVQRNGYFLGHGKAWC